MFVTEELSERAVPLFILGKKYRKPYSGVKFYFFGAKIWDFYTTKGSAQTKYTQNSFITIRITV